MAPGVSVFSRVEPTYFIVSAVLFFAGLLASYPAVKHDVSFLTWYPLWVWRRVRESMSPEDPWHRLFVFLLIFNSVSLFVNFVSGFLVFLPPIFAFLLGMNVGVISVEEAGAAGLVSLLFNPVAWLELPAAWTSLAIGIQLGTRSVADGAPGAISVFPRLAEVYFYVVVPLLVAAALLEATLIRLPGSPVED
jgi:uncharacterized membrane protein SpoIIM required for sporulation